MQRRKPKPQTYRKSNVYNSFFYILRVTTIRASNHKRSLTNFRALKATQKTPQTVTLKTRDTLSFEFAASKKTFNISYLSLHLKILCICDVQTNKRKKKNMWRDSGMRRYQDCRRRRCLEVSLIMPQFHCSVVLYIRLWMWAPQVPPVGWILLQHQYLQCWQRIAAPEAAPWPAELWTLYHVHSTWTFTSLLHWSAV